MMQWFIGLGVPEPPGFESCRGKIICDRTPRIILIEVEVNHQGAFTAALYRVGFFFFATFPFLFFLFFKHSNNVCGADVFCEEGPVERVLWPINVSSLNYIPVGYALAGNPASSMICINLEIPSLNPQVNHSA
jgi:hypothetical protein